MFLCACLFLDSMAYNTVHSSHLQNESGTLALDYLIPEALFPRTTQELSPKNSLHQCHSKQIFIFFHRYSVPHPSPLSGDANIPTNWPKSSSIFNRMHNRSQHCRLSERSAPSMYFTEASAEPFPFLYSHLRTDTQTVHSGKVWVSYASVR